MNEVEMNVVTSFTNLQDDYKNSLNLETIIDVEKVIMYDKDANTGIDYGDKATSTSG
jgi:hypothetical protein